MARSRSKSKKKQLILSESTLQKLKTVFEDKVLQLNRGSIHSGVRNRIMAVDYRALRTMAERLSPASMCINCRELQLAPFLEASRDLGQPGFCIHKKGQLDRRLRQDDKTADALTEFVFQTGHVYDPDREDDFIDFGKMLQRDALTIDQVAIELQRNRRGEIAAYWLIDGATISRCFEEGYEGDDKYVFVQEIDQKITAKYTREDLIFDCMYKRVDIRYRGYGWSLLEQALDLVTTLLLGISYNRDLFVKDRVPKGFLALQGEADQPTLDAITRYWEAAMSGFGARFTIPVLPSGKDGAGIKFESLGQTNKDMEYHKLMNFFLSLFAAVFSIDPAELGLKTDLSQPIIGEQVAGRISYSKDRGLRANLAFLRTIMNKILAKIDKDYEFSFIGLDPEDEARKWDIRAKQVAVSKTVNEIREEDGDKPLEGEENNTILNPQLVQLKQMLQPQGGMEGEGGEFSEEGTPEEGGEEEQSFEDAFAEQFGKETAEKAIRDIDNHLEELRKAGYDVEVKV